MNRPPMPFGIGTYHVIARSRQATWQSVTPAAQRAARPQRGRRDADCHGPDGPRNDRGRRGLVPFCWKCGGHRWRVLRNGHNRSLMGFPSPVPNGMEKRPPGFGRAFCYSCSMSCFRVMPSKKSSIIRPSLVHMARLWQLRSQAASQLTGLKLPSVSRRISPTV